MATPGHSQTERTMVRLLIVALIYALVGRPAQAQGPESAPQRAYFIFGDSLVDVGANNYLATVARANFPPYGIDFPYGPTGRFSNARNSLDVLTQLLASIFIPTYEDPDTHGSGILRGVNYGSGGSGIRDETGSIFGAHISMNLQIKQFNETQQEFIEQLGFDAAQRVFADSIYFSNIGTNDLVNNYLLPASPTRALYTPEEYINVVLDEYSSQLTTLYNMGARKMVVFNVGPLGCLPIRLALHLSPNGTCIAAENDFTREFNSALVQMVNSLTAQLRGSTILLANPFDVVLDQVLHPENYGLTVVNTACCGGGLYNAQTACVVPPCPDRNEFLFWDAFHPSDVVNRYLGEAYYYGGPPIISPINVQQLAAMP
ncbi:hypothetical protein R1sor_020123 [Riccia sorocarpa]|uniref:GDSL esterase/lipase n=1 Tax=Riccia sorocarpa TaxID=122646 RepID=A0ABD3IIQ0_9MARC